jgi:Ca2+-binding EF-hand superfamily protein
MLRGFDTNKDGVIDPSEVPEDRRRFLTFIGGRMDVDFSKPVAIDKLRQKATEQFGGSKKKEPEPLVPGFGVPKVEATVLAFGDRPPVATSPSSGQRSSARGGSQNEQNSRAQEFAEMMMRRYDRDGNGVLERDKGEWEGIRGDPNEIDRNKDGRIDREEMVARVATYMGGDRGGDRGDNRGGDQSGDRGGNRGGDRGGNRGQESKDSRKSYRFLSAGERLPEGLPSWFKEKDKDGDGQITMAEFSSTWTDSEARKFLRYDLNDDGIVTPDECLAAMSLPDTPAPVAEVSPASSQSSGASPSAEPKPPEKKEPSGGEKPWWM